MVMTKRKMPETMYRTSRCCRVLGNPTAYLILRCLGTRRMTPTEIARELEISLPAVSMTLRHMRQVDLVRYETNGHSKEYWVKDEHVLRLICELEKRVDAMREKRT